MNDMKSEKSTLLKQSRGDPSISLQGLERLESELDKLRSEGGQPKLESEKKRELCSAYSTILMNDPYTALRNDISSRLWKKCCYRNINALRMRISKEERKKNSVNPDLIKNLKAYCNEAKQLYKYVIDYYEQQLKSNKTCDGVVPNLYCLLIHMGDLNRYDEDITGAETCYLRASRLAPGRGHPYNQLAVVSQSQKTKNPKIGQALYWYVRALLATFESFDTSRKNLANLFTSNKGWLNKNRSVIDRIESVTSEIISNKKSKTEQYRTSRSEANQYFLAQFVYVNGIFFEGQLNKDEMLHHTSFVFNHLHRNLQEEIIGDNLVLKMISVIIFSCVDSEKNKELNPYAYSFLLRFVAIVGNRIVLLLDESRKKNNAFLEGANKEKGHRSEVSLTKSLKMLPPVLLVCSWIGTLDQSNLRKCFNQTEEFHVIACQTFWESICSLVNALRELYENGKSERRIDKATLKEFDTMKGFAPFSLFIPHQPRSSFFNEECEPNLKGFLSFADAAVLLRKDSDQRSAGFKNENENRVRAKKLYDFLESVSFRDRNDKKFIHFDEVKQKFYFRCGGEVDSGIRMELRSTSSLDNNKEQSIIENGIEDTKDLNEDDEDIIVYSGTEKTVEEQSANEVCMVRELQHEFEDGSKLSKVAKAHGMDQDEKKEISSKYQRDNYEHVERKEHVYKMSSAGQIETEGPFLAVAGNLQLANVELEATLKKPVQPPPGFTNQMNQKTEFISSKADNVFKFSLDKSNFTTNSTTKNGTIGGSPVVQSNIVLPHEVNESRSLAECPRPPPGFSLNALNSKSNLFPRRSDGMKEYNYVDSFVKPVEGSVMGGSIGFEKSGSNTFELNTLNPFAFQSMSASDTLNGMHSSGHIYQQHPLVDAMFSANISVGDLGGSYKNNHESVNYLREQSSFNRQAQTTKNPFI